MADPKKLYDWIKTDLVEKTTLDGTEELHIAGATGSEKTTIDDIKTFAQSDLGTAAFEDTTAFSPSTHLHAGQNITPDAVVFDLTPTVIPATTGATYWNSVDGTLDTVLASGVTLQHGQETHFYGKAVGNVANGNLCQFAGVQGDHILFKTAVAAEIKAAPHYLIGVATHDIINGEFGYVTSFGKINGVYTATPANGDNASWIAGDLLYFNNTTGGLTKTVPNTPEIRIIVAVVIKAQTGASENGIILVRPTYGMKLTDLDDVNGTPLTADGQIYVWHNTAGYLDATKNINDYTPILHSTENFVPSGFPSHLATTLSLIENVGAVNDTFSVTITGTDFPVYIAGNRYLKDTETVTQVGATSRRYFIYYDAITTNLTISNSAWDLDPEGYDGKALVTTVLWDAVGHKGILEEERHHSWRDVHWHHFNHHTQGAAYSTAHHGNAFTLTNPGADQYATFVLSAGSIYDEDIPNDVSAATTCNLFYHHTDGTMTWDKGATSPYKLVGGVPVVDTGTSLVQKTGSNTTGYFVSWMYGTNGTGANSNSQIAVVIGQDANNAMTLTEAQNVAFPSLPTGFILEWKLLYKMIFRYGAGNALTHISNTDYRTAGSLPSGQAPTSSVSASNVVIAASAFADTSIVNAQLLAEKVDGLLVDNMTSADGDVTHAPTRNVLFDELAQKVATSDARIIETRTDLTATNGSTMTLDLSASRNFKIDASGFTSGAYTIAIANQSTSNVTALTLIVVTGAATLPTVTWPSGATYTLTASKTHILTLVTINGTSWHVLEAKVF